MKRKHWTSSMELVLNQIDLLLQEVVKTQMLSNNYLLNTQKCSVTWYKTFKHLFYINLITQHVRQHIFVVASALQEHEYSDTTASQ